MLTDAKLCSSLAMALALVEVVGLLGIFGDTATPGVTFTGESSAAGAGTSVCASPDEPEMAFIAKGSSEAVATLTRL